MTFVMVLSPALAFAQSVPPGVTQIVPDGRTATTVTANGSVTNVTTSTISGATGFNSFSQFKIGAGNTGNLILPNGTSNLVNLVHDSPVVVDGILNGYKNGQIGGNVYFADPHGFIVGKGGVVNVGSLNVSTPTKEFMEGVIGPGGQINSASVNQLMSGNVPLSPDGFIAIKGRVNAQDGARLIGQDVAIGGRYSARDMAQLGHAAKFAATVNSKGLRSASGIVVRNGSIQIVAGNSARINGKLSASGHRGRNGGNVTVTAKNIDVGKRANISTSAKSAAGGNAGNVTLLAQDKLTVRSGATFSASSKAGDGGVIELSSKNTVTLASAVYDLSAPNGKAGTLFVDPVDLVIDVGSSVYSNGGQIVLLADHSITIAADGVLDSRAYDHTAGDVSVSNPLTGNSGNISLTAPNIKVDGKVLAGTGASGFTAGDVSLIASASQTLASGKAVSSATIEINGTITGGNILATTDATAISSYVSGLGVLAMVGQSFQALFSGLNGGYVAGQATSTVNVNNGATVTGSGTVTLQATAKEEASDPAISVGGLLPVAATAVVGEIDATVAAKINSGATVTAGGGLSVIASNDAKLAVSALGVSRNGVTVDATIAYSQARVDTNASVSSGATVSIGQNKDVTVVANNLNNFATSATAMALGSAKAGIAFAYSDVSTSATAHLGASLGNSTTPVGNIKVEGLSYNARNSSSASVTVGNPALVTGLIDAFLEAASATQAGIANMILNTAPGQSGSTAVPKFGSAISIMSSNIASTANIAADAGGSGPTIYANGNVSVYSDTNVVGTRNLADSTINSESENPTASNPTAKVAISAAVAVGTFAQSSNAYIGPGSTIRAYNIGVNATTEVPITNTWTQWAGFAEVLSHLNGNLGVVNNILSSYANATSTAQNLALAGSFDYFALDTKTSAWVGSGSSLTTVLNTTPTWSFNLYNSNQAIFSEGVDVHATSDIASVNVSGNITPLLGGTGSTDGSAVGGSLGILKSSTSTIAGIADNVSVSVALNTGVNVNAQTHDTVFTVAPSSGKASDFGLSGLATVVQIDNTTHASISDSATIDGSAVNVSATQELSLMSISAAVTISRGSAVGLSVATLVANTDTAAYIGANHSDIVAVAAQDDPVQVTRTAGHVHSTALNVAATTSGRLYAVSAAAAVQDPTPSTPLTAQLKAAGNVLTAASTGDVIGAATALAQATTSSGGPAGFSLQLAGSSSVTDSSLKTRAFISGGALDTNGAQQTTTVIALNNSMLVNASGSAALSLGNPSGGTSAAVAGAIAVGLSDNQTQAYVENTTVANSAGLTVRALASGEETVIAIGLAASAASTSAGASLSASVARIRDSVDAHVANSSITGFGSSADILVDAYQTSNIAIGGGSLYLGGKGGFGIALTYAEVIDPTGGAAVSATIANTSISSANRVEVYAGDAAAISAGAAAGGGGPDANGLAGAIVISHITPTIAASINSDGRGSAAIPVIDVGGGVTVTADSGSVSAYNAILANVVTQTNNGNAVSSDSGVDFTAAAANGGTGNGAGASITSIAGLVQAGANNVGLSLVQNTIAQTHSATLRGVDLTSTNDVTVIATDRSKILGVTVGLGLATGAFAGLASTTINLIDNTVLAQIGNDSSTTATTKVHGRNIAANAVNASDIRGAAGTLGLGLGGAAAGLSLVYDSILGSVTADINGALLAASQSVGVNATSNASILTVALGIALSNTVGVAGSVATSIIRTNVNADIRNASDVIANNNVQVVSGNTNTIQVIAGAAGVGLQASGVGISVVANEIGGTTQAYIDASTVDAKGNGSGQNVNSGTLANGVFNVSTADDPSAALPDLSETQIAVDGLAVVASSHQAIVTDAVTLGLSVEPFVGDAAALTAVSNVAGGSTLAYINGSSVSTRLAASGGTDIYVGASSQTYSRNLIISGALAGGFAGAGAGSGTNLTRTTKAYVTSSTVGGSNKPNNVTVTANSTQVSSNVVIGLAIGFGGGAASVLVNKFSADTEAYVDGGSITSNGLAVNAKSTNGFFAAAGAGAAGVVGIAGAFVVGFSSNTTKAYIGDAGQDTTINVSSALLVSAISDNTFNSYSIGGAFAGLGAVAGMANATVINNTTEARIERATGTQQSSSVTVNAAETVTVSPTTGAGALAVSGAGIGAAVNVVMLKSAVAATVLNSTLSTSGAFNVTASSAKNINLMTATVAAGLNAGIAGAASVLLIGTTAPGDASNAIADTVASVDSASSANSGNGIRSGNHVPGNDQPAAASAPAVSVASQLGTAHDTVVAEITGGATTAGSVGVTAQSQVRTYNLAQGYGLGGVGVGAAVAYTRLNENVAASLSGTVAANAVNVQATMGDNPASLPNPPVGSPAPHAVDVQAYAGAGGLIGGAGAAVADGAETSSVTANIGGTITGTNAGSVTANAEDHSSVNALGVGAAVGGGVALGVSSGLAAKSSTVTAQLAQSTTVANYDALNVTAGEDGSVRGKAIAGAGGIGFAGTGAGATATDNGTVKARVGNGSILTIGTGDILIAADATPQATAEAVGVAVAGGAGVGASVALATVVPVTEASIGNSVTIRNAASGAPDITVRARNVDPGSSDYSAKATAIAGTGGYILGLNATDAEAENNGSSSATVGDSLTLGSTSGQTTTRVGNVTISASNTTDQYATTTGVSAGSYALGFNFSSATSNNSTTASLGNLGAINAASLSVNATGTDTNYAAAVSGTGGVIAGNAASAETSAVSTVNASIGGSDATHLYNLAGGLTVAATHTVNFDGSTNSVNASIAGGSGAFLKHAVDSTVNATIADSAIVRATSFALTGNNNVSHTFSDPNDPDGSSWNLKSGSGGVLNLPAARIQIDVVANTNVSLGNNQDIHILAPAVGNSTFRIEANNVITVQDKANLDSGGVIALADVRADMNVTDNATIAIGRANNTQSNIIVDVGDVQIGAWTTAVLDLRVAATTYGYAGAPTGDANITYNGRMETDVRPNTRLESTMGALTLAAGDSPDGQTTSSIGASATVDLYNKTVIAIPATPDPTVRVTSDAVISVDNSGTFTNAGVRSAGDMQIYADRGTITMNAVGTGKDIYREALAQAASAVSNLFGGGDITFDYHGGSTGQGGIASANIDGMVLTGVQRSRFLTISFANSNGDLLFDASPGVSYTVDNSRSVSTTILIRLAQLQNLLLVYGGDPVASGAYASEILFLQRKLVAMGLATGDPANGTYNIGAWAQNIQTAYAAVQRDAVQLASSLSGISAKLADVVTYSSNAYNAATSVQSNAGTVLGYWGNNSSFDTNDWLAVNIISNMTGLSKWSTAAASATYTTYTNALSSARSYASSVNTDTSALNTLNSELNALKGAIIAQQQIITAQNAIVSSAGSSQASIDAAYATLNTAITTLNTAISSAYAKMGEIQTRNTQLQTDLTNLRNATNDVKSALLSLQTLATDTSTSNGNPTAAAAADAAINNSSIAPKLAKYSQNISDAVTYQAGVTTGQTNTITATTAFGDPTVLSTSIFGIAIGLPANTPAANIAYYSSTYTNYYGGFSGLGYTVAGYAADTLALQNSSSGLTGRAVSVNDITAVLGDLSIRADRLTGTGKLQAPGDARIALTNNADASLLVNNLTINSESGGHLRLNGVLVNSNADINALNRGGAVANFSDVTTARTQAAQGIFPAVTIVSNYDPTTSAHPNPAPDIVLNSGTAINNPLGSVTIQSQAGNIYSNGQINANTVTIQVRNGDFVQSYVFGYDHVAGDPAGTGLNGGDPEDTSALGGGIIANGSVFISARYLNINGLIQSGIDNWTLNLPSTPTLTASAALFGIDLSSAIGTFQTNGSQPVTFAVNVGGHSYNVTYTGTPGQIQFGTDFALADYATGSSHVANALYQLVTPSGSNMMSYYDAANNRYQVDATSVLGGYVQLYGQIMNTSKPNADGSAVGRIRVLDGFGQINLTNNSSYDVYVTTLNTGLDNSGTGRGVAGVIDITNILNVNDTTGVVSALRTVYTRSNGQIQVANTSGTLNSLGQVVGTTSYSTAGGDGRNTVYDLGTIAPGQRYVYTTGTDQSTATYLTYHGTQIFGSSTLTVDSSTHFDSVDGPHTLSQYRIANGTYTLVDAVHDSTGNYHTQVSRTNRTVYVTTAEWTDCNWWTLCTAQDHYKNITKTDYNTIIDTYSLKANYPIAIQFGGVDSGIVNVTSNNGAVLLGGVISNKNGSTTITGKSIVQANDNALISSKNVTLNAIGVAASIGALANGTTAARPIQVDITNGGVLSGAVTQGNFVVDVARDTKVGVISAGGDPSAGYGRVVLSAGGDISAANSNSYIQGARIELDAVNGAIGTSAQPLVIRVGATDTTSDFVGYYGFKALAANDINVTAAAWTGAYGNPNGDLLLDTVVSLGGNVTLTAPGRIIDNNPIQSTDTRTYNQLLSYWTSLGLVGGTQANADKQAAQVAVFEASRNADYKTYWQIRAMQADGGAAFDPNFHYVASASEQALLTQQFTAQSIPTGQIAGKIADYEASRTAQYLALNAEVGGYTASYDAAFNYGTAVSLAAQRATEEAALVNGISWTTRELAFSLSPGALKTITGTNPIIKAPNVSGNVVTLNAGQGLGQAIATVSLDTTTIPADLANLTTAQKNALIAIAAAERSDFVNFGASATVITVAPKQPLNFTANTALNVSVIGTAYLASMGDALLGNISVSGETRIKVRGSIVNATPTSAAIETDTLTLEASSGGIGLIANNNGGYDDQPLRVAAHNGKAVVARAQAGIDITSVATLNIDTVFSPNDIKLTSTAGSLLNANGDLLINILGRNVVLNAAAGTIGAVGALHALNVGNSAGGGVTVTALGLVNIYGPAGYQLVLKSLASAADVVVTAALDATVDGAVTSAGRVEFDVAGLLSLTDNANVTSTASSVEVNTSFGTLPPTSRLAMASGAQMSGNTGIAILTGADAAVTVLNSSAGDISVQAGGAFTERVAGQIISQTGSIAVTADSIAMGAGAGMTAGTTIALQAARDVTLGALTSTFAPAQNAAPVIVVTAGSPTLAGAIISNGDGQTNITTTRPNASVLLTAGGGIGVNSRLNPPAQPLVPVAIKTNIPLLSASTTLGDINIVNTGDLRLLSASSPVGRTNITTTGAFLVDSVSGTDVVLSAPGDITIGTINATTSVTINANSATGHIVQGPGGPGGPLVLNVSGPNGSTAQSMNLSIDAPGGTNVGQLFVMDAYISTNGMHFGIGNGYVPGKLVLTMPNQTIVLDNRSPVPTVGPGVQMYGPGMNFDFQQNGFETVTSNYVVSYSVFAAITALNAYQGMSFIRDFPRDQRSGETFDVQGSSGKSGPASFYILGLSPSFSLDLMLVPKPIEVPADRPPVNLGGLQ
jgi:hypothetical protein